MANVLKRVSLTIVVLSALALTASSSVAQEGAKLPAKKKLPSKPLKIAKPLGRDEVRSPLPGGVLAKVSVKGNKKIEADAIRARVKSKLGEPIVASSVRDDIQSIFKMGYFYDVQVTRESSPEGTELVYTVVEKPSVVEIKFEGQSEITEDDLKETAGLKAYEILDINRIRDAVEKLQKSYEDKGYFLARISWALEDIEKGESVRLKFKVIENEKVKVKKITFLGNRRIGANKLKGAMITSEGDFFSGTFGGKSFKQDAFERDSQVLNYLYFNEGFVQVKVDRPQVYVTPDKKGIYITIRIEEGEQFDVGSVDFSGDLLFTKDEMFESTEIQHSGIFVYETLQKDLRTLQAKYGDLGYAFANIIPRTQIREKERKVDITFEIDKGNKVYFGEINVTGNSKTRDKVVRRELKIKEGELYHETRRRESLENVKRLGFFEEVNFNTSTPPDKPDVLNLDIVVKERNTGTIQVGAGYSSYGGAMFNGKIDQTNLFGRGQKLGLDLNFSQRQNIFIINFTEPYFLDTRWSLGGDLYQSQTQEIWYNQTRKGAAIRVGHPLADYFMGYIRYKNDMTSLELNQDAKNAGLEPVYPVETVNGRTSSVAMTLDYDKRDDRFSPTKGFASSLDVEYAGVGGDLKYTKGGADAKYFKKVFWDVVWRNNLVYGFVTAPSGNPPFNVLYKLGGANNLRGYPWFSLGKKKTYMKPMPAPEPARETQFVYGGTQQSYFMSELEYPLVKEAGIKGVFFYDAGVADDVLTYGDVRSDLGFGFRWYSPIGPLRFEWGFPINRGSEFDAVNFEFFIGTPF